MAHVFKVTVTTQAERFVLVAAETADEASAKVVVNPGETVVNVSDEGELLQ